MRPVIVTENLSKQYRLGTIGTNTLREDIERWTNRLRGKPSFDSEDSRHAKKIWVLQDVNLQVNQGEAVGIVGRNGAGKSTLLKILCRITAPTKGLVKIKGRIASLLEIGTGFHPELTGRENVFLSGAILGMHKAEIQKKFDEIVDFSGIKEFIDTPVKRYSSGMYVRLAFAVAAHLESEILIVDEVLAVGDAEFQRKCLGRMDNAATHGRTVLFVSHNMAAVQRLCSRAIFLDHGTVQAIGDSKIVTARYLDSLGGQCTSWERKSLASSDIFFTKVFLTNYDGEPIDHVTTATEVRMVMDFRIQKPVNDMQLGITVYDAERNSLFSSAPGDVGLPIDRKTGIYRYAVQLPTNIFMPRTYTIKAVLWSVSQGTLDAVEQLTFPVHEAASLLNDTPGGRHGALLLVCNWVREEAGELKLEKTH